MGCCEAAEAASKDQDVRHTCNRNTPSGLLHASSPEGAGRSGTRSYLGTVKVLRTNMVSFGSEALLTIAAGAA